MRTIAICAALLSLASSAFAQDRGWVAVNAISMTAAQESQTYVFNTTVFNETASAATNYPKLPRAAGVGVAAGLA